MNALPVVVVGAGAAGIMAALSVAARGQRVVLLEKTSRIGTKITISGGGKCNIAHDGPLEDVIRAFIPSEARFLRPSAYKLPNTRIMEIFVDRGIELITREDGRVFPVSKSAKDVVKVLADLLVESEVEVFQCSPVVGLNANLGSITGVWVGSSDRNPTNLTVKSRFGAKALLESAIAGVQDGYPVHPEGLLKSDRVIVCTGGSSYPKSGTTGDAWKWLKDLGHSIVPIRAALAPIYLSSPFVELSGVSLKGVVLLARSGGKSIAKWQGDLLFTHLGVSGPCALGISRMVAGQLVRNAVELFIDLVPETTSEALNDRFINSKGHTIGAAIKEEVPERYIKELYLKYNLSAGQRLSNLSRVQRKSLVTGLKEFPLGLVKAVPVEKGEVVAGGVNLEEVDSQTLESKKVKGLYLCGELLDISGPVGGYNLQAAFATGWAAGIAASE